MFRPINADRRFSGTCLAESFAEKYSQKFGVDVGLICCADGGTSLDQWKESSLLFDNAVYNAKLAQRTSTIAGILWHQGESDCSPEKIATYKERFEKMINALKRELDLYDVPVLIGGLGDFLPFREDNEFLKNYASLNEQLKLIAETNDMTGYVSAEGLTANPDNLHFNAAALYEFGQRYFNEFDKIRDINKVLPEKYFVDDVVRTAF